MCKINSFLMFVGLILVCNSVQGQNNDTQAVTLDSVYLKSGRLYEGVVSEHVKGQFLRMKKTDGKEVIIGDIDIARVIDNNQDVVKAEVKEDEPFFQVDEELLAEDKTEKNQSLAYDENILDVVYLKDGSVLKGEITQYIQGESLTIMLTSGTELVVAEEEIDRIRQELPDQGGAKPKSKKELRKERGPVYVESEKGWYNVTSLSSYSGRLDGEFEMGLGIQNVVGYQFGRYFGLGLGLGVDAQSLDGSENLYPVFMEWRGYFSKRVKTPYFSFSGGYTFAFKNPRRNIVEAEGGYMFHPSIGYRLSEDAETNVLIDIGYRFQRATFVREFAFEDKLIKRIDYRRFCIRLGLIF